MLAPNAVLSMVMLGSRRVGAASRAVVSMAVAGRATASIRGATLLAASLCGAALSGAPSVPAVAVALVPAAIAVVGITGCAGTTMLLESDVPLPEGMSTVRSADIRRAAGTVTSGRFILAGQIDDASRVLDATIGRFESAGWRLDGAERGLDHAVASFRKGDRTARLVLDRRTLDPDMSSGSLVVSSPTSAASASASGSASASPTAESAASAPASAPSPSADAPPPPPDGGR